MTDSKTPLFKFNSNSNLLGQISVREAATTIRGVRKAAEAFDQAHINAEKSRDCPQLGHNKALAKTSLIEQLNTHNVSYQA